MKTNTHKFRALAASLGGAVCGFINWLATVPPEQQSGWLAQLVEITPVEYRPNVGVFTRLLMLFLVPYAAHQAAKSGPQSPPKNDPDK